MRCGRGEWITSGLMKQLREKTLEAHDEFIGLRLADVFVDCCLPEASCGGEMAASRSPVDRASGASSAPRPSTQTAYPSRSATAPANGHDSPLLALSVINDTTLLFLGPGSTRFLGVATSVVRVWPSPYCCRSLGSPTRIGHKQPESRASLASALLFSVRFS